MESPSNGTGELSKPQQSNPILARLEARRTDYLLKKKELDDVNISEHENEEDYENKYPQKSKFRMRAHVNPLNDTPWPFPLNPNEVDWSKHFPLSYGKTEKENQDLYLNTEEFGIEYTNEVNQDYNGFNGTTVNIVDIGCGYGGLLFGLAKNFPDKQVLGMEIRDKCVNFVGEKIRSLRFETEHKEYGNISVLRQNTMRHATNYFRKGQLDKLFFCFPDPHFKKTNFRRRIVQIPFLTEYAYMLKVGGRIYTITDVEDLHKWHVEHLEGHRLFRKLTEEEMKNDICVDLIQEETEEGKKVTRNNGSKWHSVYERIAA